MESVGIKPPMVEQSLTLRLGEKELCKIAKAISSETRQKILAYLNQEPMDVSKIASLLDQTEANISAQVKILQKANLVTCHYEKGGHGVRKVCEISFSKIEINLF